MAEAVVSIALQTLGDLLLEEAKFLSGVRREVKGLEKQLKEIKCLLEDADKRQHESRTILNWIADIRDLAHRSEDAIETYAVEISSKRESGFRKKLLGRFSCVLNDQCFSLHQIGSEISEIKSEIARIKDSMKEFGIQSIIRGGESSSTANPNHDNQRWKRQTYPVETEDCFVGKDDDLKKLVSLIVDDEGERLISIWGMGGIGKTTIARKVYNHSDTKRFFECFVWVCITQQCHIRSVLENILNQLIPQKGDIDISSLSDTELIEQLCQIQVTKRCLVVLDDLWEAHHWDGLKHGFLVQDSKSKVLVTTRKQNVADHMGFAFELGLLKIDDGWELLKKKATFNSNPDNFVTEEKLFKNIGKEMVRKCGRLPLVISILGGLLSKRKSMEEWESVNENINAHLYREKNHEIHGVLNLSYEDLPFYLKPCFLFMGQFREDADINCRDLCRMWIAHGMISHESRGNDTTLMDIADGYLNELASRCLVQILNIAKDCNLHDAVRELCLSKGKMEGFSFHVMTYRSGEFSSLLNESLSGIKPRYLAIHFEGEMASKPDGFTVHCKETSQHVRSLQFLNEEGAEKIEFQEDILDLEKFKLLRVLVFHGFRFKSRQLRGIGNLIHLRYLVFQACELDELPSSISNLIYLNTLDLWLSYNVQVPNVLKKMHRLRHLILPVLFGENIGKYRLTLEGLDELETLYNFNSLVHDLEPVIRMKNLGYIDAEVHDNKSLLAIIKGCTTNWTKLSTLNLVIDEGCQLTSTEEDLMILKNVFSCEALGILLIYKVPIRLQLEECVTEINTSQLSYLDLLGSEIEDDPMGILGQIPFLKVLRLRRTSFVGEEMKCHASGFPRLRELLLAELPNFREWTVEQGAMPLLSDIKIENCPHLKMIPDGLRFLLNLEKLTITGMQEFRERVDEEEGQDFYKVHHVPSIIIYNN